MTKLLLQLICLLLINVTCFSQNTVQLNIKHKLGDADFELGLKSANNLNHQFNVKRLQYYISEISVIHDGGNETKIEDLWILVDATKLSSVELGKYDIQEVEQLNLHIGVDKEHNHLDPATFGVYHPLSPKFPSMHWGWSSGYRFVAMEGKGGNKLNQVFEIHALGDKNYFKTEIVVSAKAEDNVININLDADYNRALENIQLNAGLIMHGEIFEAVETLLNFKNHVFSPSPESTSNQEVLNIKNFDIYPNPTYNGYTTVRINSDQSATYDLSITNILGNEIAHFKEVRSHEETIIKLKNKGLYFVSLVEQGQTIITKKLVIK